MRAHATKNGKVALRYPPAVYHWRAQVQQAVAELGLHQAFPRGTAVEVRLGFDLPRPMGHYLPRNSRRTKPELHPKAPSWPTGPADTDKLVRAVLDAITDAGLWHDDSQVVVLVAAKRYTCGAPGVRITVEELETT
jgi:Holliday junction resolvase RusA-like endonuclease